MRPGMLIALGVAVALLAPAGSQAGSIAYVKGGDVHLSDGRRDVTLTSGGGYESPSQADDGTIAAVRATEEDGLTVRRIHRMSRTGELLNPPTTAVPLSKGYRGPLAPAVSPDGRVVAYMYFAPPWLFLNDAGRPRLSFAYADRDTERSAIFETGYYLNPTWVSGSTVAIFPATTIPDVQLYTLGGAISDWFDEPDVKLGAGDLARSGDRFAATAEGGAQLRLYATTGPPPAPPVLKCKASLPADGGDGYRDPSWSPDGRELAWEQKDGIHVAEVADLESCAIKEALAFPGGSAPDWAAADVPAGAPAGGGATGGGPGTATRPAVSVAPRPTRAAVRAGLPVTVSCPRACRATVRLLAGRRVLARATRRLAAGRRATVRLRARVARGARLTVRVQVAARTVSRRVTVR